MKYTHPIIGEWKSLIIYPTLHAVMNSVEQWRRIHDLVVQYKSHAASDDVTQ